MIASSKWQLLGYNPPGEDGEEWAVTFFEKTLFTPAGLDIYARMEKGLPEDLVRRSCSLVNDVAGCVSSVILILLCTDQRNRRKSKRPRE